MEEEGAVKEAFFSGLTSLIRRVMRRLPSPVIRCSPEFAMEQDRDDRLETEKLLAAQKIDRDKLSSMSTVRELNAGLPSSKRYSLRRLKLPDSIGNAGLPSPLIRPGGGIKHGPSLSHPNTHADADSDCRSTITINNDLLSYKTSRIWGIKHGKSLSDPKVKETTLPLLLIVTLNGIHQGKHLKVGARVKPSPQECMEFFFFDLESMAACVGVAMLHAKVLLDKDFNIAIHELALSDWVAEEKLWKATLGDENCHRVMNFREDSLESPSSESEQVLKDAMESGKTLPIIHGLGFAKVFQYMDETFDRTEVNWVVLHDVASFIILQTSAKQCSNGSKKKSHLNTDKVHLTSGRQRIANDKRKRDDDGHDMQGEDGNGEKDGDGNVQYPMEDDDSDIPLALRVIVNPLPKNVIFNPLFNMEVPLPFCGLEGASIAPQLVFDFRRNHDRKRISIRATTRLELRNGSSVLFDDKCFGWYHDRIQIKLSCDDVPATQSGRIAILEQHSCKMLNEITTTKYILGKTSSSSTANNHSVQGQAKVGLSGMVELQGTLGGSRNKEEATSRSQTTEVLANSICTGFLFTDGSRTECPASAIFDLFYPLDRYNIWNEKTFLRSQGLFSTIEPKLAGTWIPFNDMDSSPYSFSVERFLKYQREGLNGVDCSQSYLLSFYVNHAMTHLRRKKSPPVVQIYGDQQEVPHVMKVARVC